MKKEKAKEYLKLRDDEKDIVSALKIYLMADGYQVFEAYNGREALEILKNEDIHLVLMDLSLIHI